MELGAFIAQGAAAGRMDHALDRNGWFRSDDCGQSVDPGSVIRQRRGRTARPRLGVGSLQQQGDISIDRHKEPFQVGRC
jgi:hypothetical protein